MQLKISRSPHPKYGEVFLVSNFPGHQRYFFDIPGVPYTQSADFLAPDFKGDFSPVRSLDELPPGIEEKIIYMLGSEFTISESKTRGENQCASCGRYIDGDRHQSGISNRCDLCQQNVLSSGGSVDEAAEEPKRGNAMSAKTLTLLREAVLRVARGAHVKPTVSGLLRKIYEDTDVEVKDDESGGDAAEMLDDLTVGMEGPDPTVGAGGDPPQGEATAEPIKVEKPLDPADAEPGGPPAETAPTDGEENSFAVESWRKGADAVLSRYLGEDDDSDDGGDDDSDDDGDDKKKKKDDNGDDDSDDKKEEGRRRAARRSRLREEDDDKDDDDFKGKKAPPFKKDGEKDDDDGDKKKEESRRSLREQDGSYQIGTDVIFTPKSGEPGGIAQVAHKYPHMQGYTYQLELEGVGAVLAEDDELSDAPGTPEGFKAVS